MKGEKGFDGRQGCTGVNGEEGEKGMLKEGLLRRRKKLHPETHKCDFGAKIENERQSEYKAQ